MSSDQQEKIASEGAGRHELQAASQSVRVDLDDEGRCLVYGETCKFCDEWELEKPLLAKHDKEIGWPKKLKPPQSSAEYKLRLTNFSRKSQDSIFNALWTLVKYGIGPSELASGHVDAKQGASWRHEPREWFEEMAREEETNPGILDPRFNAMSLLGVGPNYAEFEVPKHDVVAVANYNDENCDARQLIREMGDEGAQPGNRIVRIFGPKGRYQIDEAVQDMEEAIYDCWWDRYEAKTQSSCDDEETEDESSEKHATSENAE